MRALSFRERMREEAARAAAAESADPWRLTLERVRGKVDYFDRLDTERLTRSLVKRLERLGHRVSLHPQEPAA